MVSWVYLGQPEDALFSTRSLARHRRLPVLLSELDLTVELQAVLCALGITVDEGVPRC